MKKWSIKRIKNASIGMFSANYEVIPNTEETIKAKEAYPHLFSFKAISVGDKNGQAFIVPLDESSKETAEYILRAIKAYNGK